MKTLLIISFLLILPPTLGQDLSNVQDIIKDPIISRRCKGLLKQRSEKISIKQKLNSMLLRNQKLLRKAKPSQKNVKKRLDIHKTLLKNDLRLTTLRIKSMEENIVRKGCPGITL